MEPKTCRALPTEMQYVIWTGDFSDLPRRWRSRNDLHMEGEHLVVETAYGALSPEVGSYLLLGTADEIFVQSRAVFAYRFEVLS